MTNTTSIKFANKADLIKALRSKRAAMAESDRKVKADHAAAEKQALVDFRARLKDLGTLTYAQIKADKKRRGSYYVEFNEQSCPLLWVPRLDTILARLDLTSQKEFTVSLGSDLWELLTFGEPALSPC